MINTPQWFEDLWNEARLGKLVGFVFFLIAFVVCGWFCKMAGAQDETISAFGVLRAVVAAAIAVGMLLILEHYLFGPKPGSISPWLKVTLVIAAILGFGIALMTGMGEKRIADAPISTTPQVDPHLRDAMDTMKQVEEMKARAATRPTAAPTTRPRVQPAKK